MKNVMLMVLILLIQMEEDLVETVGDRWFLSDNRVPIYFNFLTVIPCNYLDFWVARVFRVRTLDLNQHIKLHVEANL